MTDHTPTEPTAEPLSLLQRIESLCDEFESAWRSGLRPLLRDYLALVSPDLRRRTLTELLTLDVAYRRDVGERPIIDDYLSQFPDLEDVIRGQLTSTGEQTHFTGGPKDSTVPESAFRIASPTLPVRLDDYELLAEIARGGMGVVYRARQVSLDRIVAVKLIRSEGPECAELVDRFRVEQRAAAALRHPGLVAIHAAGQVGGQHFYSMEYVDGETLSSMTRQRPSGVEAGRIVRDAARAVDYAHQRGVLHRDLKPSNIMLDRDGCVRITDFGLAKRTTGSNELTTTGQILGTPSFMSPEQALGDHEAIDARSDIYSLGAVLYALLTGRPPHEGKTVGITLLSVMSATPQKPSTINPAVDEDLERICLKCLEKVPTSRFSSAGELASALDQYLEQSRSEHRASELQNPSKRTAGQRGRSRALFITAVMVFVAIGALTLLQITNFGRQAAKVPDPLIKSQPEPSASNTTPPSSLPTAEAQSPIINAPMVETATTTTEDIADALVAIRAALPVEPSAPLIPQTSIPQRAVTPFTRAEARQFQEAWAQARNTSIETSNALEMKLVLVPPGEFLMGITDEQTEDVVRAAIRLGLTEEAARLDFGDARPQHRVVLTEPYWMGATEVTVAQYKIFADATKYQSVLERLFAEDPAARGKRPVGSNKTWREFGSEFGRNSPVVALAWNDAVAFCNWLSEQEGFDLCYTSVTPGATVEFLPHKNGYRLPTEAEWEFACRAGTTTPHSAGETEKELADVAWFSQEWDSGPRQVRQGRPNSFGLFDLHGNVFEWCQDRYDPTWYEGSPVENPDNQTAGSLGVMRGGDWYYHHLAAHSAARTRSPRASASYHAGFRIVRLLPFSP